MARWASEISLGSVVSLNENVSLINVKISSQLKTARIVNHYIESMD